MTKYLLLFFMVCTLTLNAKDVVNVSYIAGEPTEEDWKLAQACPLVPANPATTYGEAIVRRCGMDKKVIEPATVRLLWSNKYLYVRIDAIDSDIVAQSTKDQDYLFVQGDTVEIFLKPEGVPYYWELYGDVSNHKTAIFIPSRGRLGLPNNRSPKADMELTVKTQCNGTLNDMSDHDKGWMMVVQIPVSGLTRYGAEFKPGAKWTFCLVRYNYSQYLPMWERTVYPGLSNEPHLYEEFANIVLEK